MAAADAARPGSVGCLTGQGCSSVALGLVAGSLSAPGWVAPGLGRRVATRFKSSRELARIAERCGKKASSDQTLHSWVLVWLGQHSSSVTLCCGSVVVANPDHVAVTTDDKGFQHHRPHGGAVGCCRAPPPAVNVRLCELDLLRAGRAVGTWWTQRS